MTELISIIVRTYKRDRYLEQALESIYLQDYPHIEAIIVNASKDPLPDNLKIPEINYKIVQEKEDLDRAKALNVGLLNSSGKYIAFLDDDDELFPWHLSTLYQEISTEFPIVYSDAYKAIQKKDLNEKVEYKTNNFILEYSSTHSLTKILEANFIPIQSLLITKDCFKGEVFDESFAVLEDWDMWIRLSLKFKFKHVKQLTSEYRIRNDQTNIQGNNLKLWQEARIRINEKFKNVREKYKLPEIKIYNEQ